MREVVLRHLVNGGSGKVTVDDDGTVTLPTQRSILPHAPHTALYAVENTIFRNPGKGPYVLHTQTGEVKFLEFAGVKLPAKEIKIEEKN